MFTFILSISNPYLVEFMGAEPMGAEGQLHIVSGFIAFMFF
jgi:hypothetical protein